MMNNAISALKDLNRALETVLPAGSATPHSGYPTALELIVGSVAAHYIGNMESDEDCYGAAWYRPSDEEDIREILTKLWGKYLSATVREEISKELIMKGWPELFYLNYRNSTPTRSAPRAGD
jgi:hypothetical protein